MSDDVIKIGAIRSRKFGAVGPVEGVATDVFYRLQVAAEVGSRDALAVFLKEVQERAVALAPKREDKEPSEHGLINGLPPQAWAPGLLKNSIGYYIRGTSKIHGLNSFGGEYRVSDDISEYPSHGLKFGANKSKGTVQGFVGTFVCHRDYINWKDTYKRPVFESVEQVDFLKNGRTRTHKVKELSGYEETAIPDEVALFSYGVWVEFKAKPFLRPALYSVIDSRAGIDLMAKALKRDIRQVMHGQLPLDFLGYEYKQ